jgi:D-glycero-D-manno-heptose 1,7-bisphosphate phosphatase
MARPAVFFDRDGVLNEDDGFTYRPEQLRWVAGAREAVRAINQAGWLAFVITNQSGVARGFYTLEDVARFHARMSAELAAVGAWIDEFAVSPYHPEGSVAAYRMDHPTRKPRPGMILDLVARWDVDTARSFVVGDKATDMAAAAAAGMPGYLFDGGRLDVFIQTLPLRAMRQDFSTDE